MKFDLVGQRFGRLIVIKKSDNQTYKNTMWDCKCDCGNQNRVSTSQLRNGKVKSCGCLHKAEVAKRLTIHGKSKSHLYGIWLAMRRRCYNTLDSHYKNYGGRGIIVCDEWRNDFIAFNDWAIKNGYQESLSIERIDNNQNYSPNNCCWITKAQQAGNKTTNRQIIYCNQKYTLAQLSKLCGLDRRLIANRIDKLGWSVEEAITILPIRGRNQYYKN